MDQSLSDTGSSSCPATDLLIRLLMARSSGGRLPGRPAGRALHQPEECAIRMSTRPGTPPNEPLRVPDILLMLEPVRITDPSLPWGELYMIDRAQGVGKLVRSIQSVQFELLERGRRQLTTTGVV